MLKTLLEEERYRVERLEVQINDMTELQQHEIQNLRQVGGVTTVLPLYVCRPPVRFRLLFFGNYIEYFLIFFVSLQCDTVTDSSLINFLFTKYLHIVF